MKFNFNPQILEKHVEKIVLAVALAGAGWIAWSALQPITLPDNKDVTAANVEDKVTEAVKQLDAARTKTKNIPAAELTPRLQNYVAAYERVMMQHPLPPELVAVNIPRFAPLQEAIGSVNIENGGGPNQVAIAAPTVPAPKQVTAVADRGSVLPPNTPATGALSPDDQAQPSQPGAAVAPQGIDKTWVCVSGLFPMSDFINELNNPAVPDSQKLPADSRRAVIVQIQVQRHKRAGDSWTEWKDVQPASVGGPPIPNIEWNSLNDLDLLTTVTNLDASFQRIVEPIFYLVSTPTGPQPVIPPVLKAPATTNPSAAGPTAARPPIPAAPPGNQANADDQADAGDQANAGSPAPGIPDPASLKSQKDVPFWFFDDSVTPGTDYQYRVRVVMYNPTYRYPGPLKPADAAKTPLIYSDWATVTQPVSVSADLYFFVNSPVGNGPVQKVDFRVYKWTNGNWFTTEWNKEVGEEVDGPLRLINVGPPTPTIALDTHYRLIDIQTSQSGGEINAVLMSPTGELITRNSRADSSNNAKRSELQDKAVKPPRPKPPAPTTRPVQRPVPGAPGGPPNGDNGT